MKIIDALMWRFAFYRKNRWSTFPIQDLSDMHDMMSAMYAITETRSKKQMLSKKEIRVQKQTKINIDIINEILNQHIEVCRGGLFKRISER